MTQKRSSTESAGGSSLTRSIAWDRISVERWIFTAVLIST
jgi:hypothetical protein